MAKKKKAKEWKAEELVALVRKRHPSGSNKFAVFEQVAPATGWGAFSWIDVAVVSLWPSEKFLRAAFEVKVSRQDFLREANSLSKNAWCREYFHQCWIVAPKEIVKSAEEIPEGWGWLHPRGEVLVNAKQAETKESAAFDEGFFAALCRGAQKALNRDLRTAEERVLKENRHAKEWAASHEAVERFLEARGLHMPYGDDADKIAEKLEQAAGKDRGTGSAERALRRLDHFQEQMQSMFYAFAEVAFIGLMETDEAGKSLYDTFGIRGEFRDLAEKRAMAAMKAKKGGYRYESDQAKRFVKMLDILEAGAEETEEENVEEAG